MLLLFVVFTLCALGALVQGSAPSATATAPLLFMRETFDGKEDIEEWTSALGSEFSREEHWDLAAGKWTIDGHNIALHTIQDNNNYALSRPLDHLLHFCSVDGEENGVSQVTFQMFVKHEQRIECGGGYLKLLPLDFDATHFGKDSPYVLRFGSDMCGTQTRDFIFELALATPGTDALDLYTLKKSHRQKISTDRLGHVFTVILTDVSVERVSSVGDSTTPVGAYGAATDGATATCVRRSPKTTTQTLRVELLLDDDLLVEGSVAELLEPVGGVVGQSDKEVVVPDMGFVGFDLWQVRGGTFFDDIVVTGVSEHAKLLRERWQLQSSHRSKELNLFRAHDEEETKQRESEVERVLNLRRQQERELAEYSEQE